MENNVKNSQSSNSQSPLMRIFVSAFVKPGRSEIYIPLQRDLEIIFYYSPASYWKNVKVTFPNTHTEFALKRKDPEFYGDIKLDSEVNIHKVSLDPIDEPVRSDAIRKREQRAEKKSATTVDKQKSEPTKRRLSSKSPEEKLITITVALDDETYSSIFNVRTMRDLNKYRYERKCIELVKKDRKLMQSPSSNQQFSQPFSIILPQSDKMDEETLSSEEEE